MFLFPYFSGKLLQRFGVIAILGQLERRPTLFVRGVRVGSRVEQDFDEVGPVELHRQMKRSSSLGVGDRGLSPQLD